MLLLQVLKHVPGAGRSGSPSSSPTHALLSAWRQCRMRHGAEPARRPPGRARDDRALLRRREHGRGRNRAGDQRPRGNRQDDGLARRRRAGTFAGVAGARRGGREPRGGALVRRLGGPPGDRRRRAARVAAAAATSCARSSAPARRRCRQLGLPGAGRGDDNRSGRARRLPADAQWLDAATADALRFALRRLGGAPVAALVSVRQRGGRPETFETALPRERRSELKLAPLTLAAVHEVIRARLGVALPRRALVRIVERTEGNVFFALEIARELLRSGDVARAADLPLPPSVQELVG